MNPNELPQEIQDESTPTKIRYRLILKSPQAARENGRTTRPLCQMEHSHQYHHQQPDAAGLTGDRKDRLGRWHRYELSRLKGELDHVSS